MRLDGASLWLVEKGVWTLSEIGGLEGSGSSGELLGKRKGLSMSELEFLW